MSSKDGQFRSPSFVYTWFTVQTPIYCMYDSKAAPGDLGYNRVDSAFISFNAIPHRNWTVGMHAYE